MAFEDEWEALCNTSLNELTEEQIEALEILLYAQLDVIDEKIEYYTNLARVQDKPNVITDQRRCRTRSKSQRFDKDVDRGKIEKDECMGV
jgi:hypothetical protein